MDLNKPLNTIEDAKEFYCLMGCNGFHMSREYPERYREFEAMNISQELCAVWRREEGDRIFRAAVKKRRRDNSGLILQYLEIIDDPTPADLKKIYRLLSISYKHISPLYNVVIPEKLSNKISFYPEGYLSRARSLGLDSLWMKYVKLIRKMLIFAARKDEKLTERASKVLDCREQLEEARELLAMINEKMEEIKNR